MEAQQPVSSQSPSSRPSSEVFERSDAQIHVDLYAPSAEPKAVVHIVHGLAEHGARYARLAEAMVEKGWAVLAHDQRGHGRTEKVGGHRGLFAVKDGWSTVTSDLHALIDSSKSRFRGRPILLLGHSMGSLVVQGYLTRFGGQDVRAVAYSGTSGPPPPIATLGRVVARLERFRQGKLGCSKLIDKLAFGAYNNSFKPARTDFDWLSRDEAEVDLYVEDPDCGFLATNQLWIDLLDALPKLSTQTALDNISKNLPFYMFSGDEDPVGEKGKGVLALARRYEQAGLSVKTELYPGARHEVLNETNRDEVTRNLIAWFDDHIRD